MNALTHAPWLFLVALLVVACGGTQAATDDADDHTVEPDRDREPPAEGCPSSFDEARSSGGGCIEGPSDCVYAEGTCYCGEPFVCSGAIREPMPPEAYSYQCQQTPPAIRADGCPGTAPDDGSPCEIDRTCGYGRCGGPVYGCIDGAWRFVDEVAPPP